MPQAVAIVGVLGARAHGVVAQHVDFYSTDVVARAILARARASSRQTSPPRERGIAGPCATLGRRTCHVSPSFVMTRRSPRGRLAPTARISPRATLRWTTTQPPPPANKHAQMQ